jgi:1-acyl-sn-glycerol-3-phosphate acyltransferase
MPTSLAQTLTDFWYRSLARFLVFLYYHRVTVINSRVLPSNGPVLFVALHRNGAVDGYIYKSVIPRASFLISSQLRRNFFGRIFFSGLEVTRSKDRTAAGTQHAGESKAVLHACVQYVRQGEALVIMPEGSSDLGHRHLSFHTGAARILAQLLENPELPLQVIPLGIHYERAWAWQSDVEVVVGDPISTELPAETSAEMRAGILHKRITSALESLAVQAENADAFCTRERIAYAATLGSKRSYFAAMKALEQGIPEIDALFTKLEKCLTGASDGSRLWQHQGIPLMPVRFAWAYLFAWLVVFPLAGLACLFNAPPMFCAWWCGKRFSDGSNTIALWRLLTVFPCLLLWVVVLLGAALLFNALPLWFAYAVISLLGLKSVRRAQKLTIGLRNWALAPSLRGQLLCWRESLEVLMRGMNV